MRVARGAGLHDQVAVAAQADAHQVQVDGAGRQQGVDRDRARAGEAVRQQQDHRAVAHRGFGLRAQAIDRGREMLALAQEQVQPHVRVGEVLQREQLAQLALGEDRRVDHHRARIGRRQLEEVALAPDVGRQRHHALLAQRVDRRVGDLGEGLAEVVVQGARLGREHRHRGVVAHRAGGFLFGLGHHAQDRLAFLAAEAVQLLEARQRRRVEGLGRERGIDQVGDQVLHALLQPALERRTRAVDPVDRAAVEELARVQVDRDHLAGAELALGHHVLGPVVPHADLAGDGQVAVAGQHPARRPQAVAVERAGGVAAVAHHDAGRAVPHVLVERVVLVECGQVRIAVFQRFGCRRDQDPHRLQQVHAAGEQHLEHVVERHRIRAAG